MPSTAESKCAGVVYPSDAYAVLVTSLETSRLLFSVLADFLGQPSPLI